MNTKIKAGDTVYILFNKYKEYHVEEAVVTTIKEAYDTISHNTKVSFYCLKEDGVTAYYGEEAFGDVIFTTREEASRNCPFLMDLSSEKKVLNGLLRYLSVLNSIGDSERNKSFCDFICQNFCKECREHKDIFSTHHNKLFPICTENEIKELNEHNIPVANANCNGHPLCGHTFLVQKPMVMFNEDFIHVLQSIGYTVDSKDFHGYYIVNTHHTNSTEPCEKGDLKVREIFKSNIKSTFDK